MNTKARLLRKPLTTLFWSLLVAAMALFLGVGSALMYASGALAGIMDEQYTSIAVRTDAARIEVMTEHGLQRQTEEKLFTQEDLDYFMSLDSVEGVYFHTLSAATSPAFRPVVTNSVLAFENLCYWEAAVLGRVTQIIGYEPYTEDDPRISLYGVMEIEEILSQNPNYTRQEGNGAGQQLVLHMVLIGEDAVEYIQEGERYLLLTNYDYSFRGCWMQNGTEIQAVGDLMENNNGGNTAVWTDRGLMQNIGYNRKEAAEDPADDIPFMIRVDGTLEEFLAAPENQQWAWYLDCHRKQNQAVPVIGTEALETFYAFVNHDATLTQGRFFTEEEYKTGAKVCILSESLATASGIALGDTITFSQYLCQDASPHGRVNTSVSYGSGLLHNPDVGHVNYREFGPEETFTVVGLYRQKSQWADSSYAITPNTLFIPQKAQISGAFGGMSNPEIVLQEADSYSREYSEAAMQRIGGTYGIYFTMKLKNGMVQDFQTTMEASPYRGEFLTLDQGFDAIQGTLNAVAGSTRTLFLAVVLGWLLLAGLYLLLYQGTQRRNVGIMRCLGVRAKQTRNYLWGSGMMVCTIGLVLGTVATCLLTGVVQDKLLASTFGLEANRYSVAGLSDDAIMNMVASSQLPIWVIVAIGGVQLLLLAGVLYLQARSMSRKPPRDLAGK